MEKARIRSRVKAPVCFESLQTLLFLCAESSEDGANNEPSQPQNSSKAKAWTVAGKKMAEKKTAEKANTGEKEVVLLDKEDSGDNKGQEVQLEKSEQAMDEKKTVFDSLANPRIFWKVACPKV